MSPFLLDTDIIGEDVVKIPISNNNPLLEQKTEESSVQVREVDFSSSSSIATLADYNDDADLKSVSPLIDHSMSQRLVGAALKSHINTVDIDECPAGGEDSFFVADLGRVYNQYKRWMACLPRIEPFYAMKCNNDPKVLGLLSSLGLGFDCASKNEIDTIVSLGVNPKKIVYAHPCKALSYIRHASNVGVEMMTFDNSDELLKCKRAYPNAKLLLRIMTDDSKSLCQFSIKYGASMDNAYQLLKLGKELGLNIIGVSFHVGSGASDPSAFVDAVTNARQVFDWAEELGMPKMTVLDVGGGFVDETFEETAAVLGPCIEQLFPVESGVRVIAEPGRYFVSSAFTLAVNVVGRRVTTKNIGDKTHPHLMLYINDGVYANMNCIIFDHQEPVPKILSKKQTFMYNEGASGPDFSVYSDDGSEVSSVSSENSSSEVEVSIWGPTCDGIDVITKGSMLPDSVDVGDWLYFTEFGAYTLSAATTFNGFNGDCKVIYVSSEPNVKRYVSF